eukprot:gb/GEZN01010620.1/.p1 GENE.gb/GEZN01010620.1/~~gb/GEZN01010620.1/.p1  ORF type:complete len:249 (+),score=45.10 gb/GEZN01010620.1/:105-851(+)
MKTGFSQAGVRVRRKKSKARESPRIANSAPAVVTHIPPRAPSRRPTEASIEPPRMDLDPNEGSVAIASKRKKDRSYQEPVSRSYSLRDDSTLLAFSAPFAGAGSRGKSVPVLSTSWQNALFTPIGETPNSDSGETTPISASYNSNRQHDALLGTSPTVISLLASGRLSGSATNINKAVLLEQSAMKPTNSKQHNQDFDDAALESALRDMGNMDLDEQGDLQFDMETTTGLALADSTGGGADMNDLYDF